MGAGKSTVARELGARIGYPSRDLDEELGGESTIAELFAKEGEEAFRRVEAARLLSLLEVRENLVLALGGGAITTPGVRERLAAAAFTVWLDAPVDVCWSRVRGTDRPLAPDQGAFRRLFDERRPLYAQVADAVARDVDDAVLGAAGIRHGAGIHGTLAAHVPGDGPVALVTDANVAGIHGAAVQLALAERLVSTHEVPTGEAAKTVGVAERLWRELRLGRDGTIVALGGGCVTDVAGFVAATYARGLPWVAVPTTLVGQVDAAIGGKTALDLPEGKNLVGAFHWPVRTVIDPALLATLPGRERREGLAEVVKTGLLAGEALWELPEPELVRRCASFKAAVCFQDPYDRGERAMLNLGHTFAHALEAGASYGSVTHGSAVALGLLAALRLSGRDTTIVEELLDPRPVRVDRERAWRALQRDKKRGLVLLAEDGPRHDVQVPEEDVRRALDTLIAD